MKNLKPHPRQTESEPSFKKDLNDSHAYQSSKSAAKKNVAQFLELVGACISQGSPKKQKRQGVCVYVYRESERER